MTLVAHIHRLLIDQCTRADNDPERSLTQRQRYIDRVQHLLTNSQLAPRKPQAVWTMGWDKPFYAYNSAARVGPAVETARITGVFDNPAEVASAAFMRNGQPGRLVRAAIARGDLTGACKAVFRLKRVQAYAQAVPRITEALNRFHSDWLAGDLEIEELQARAVAIAEDIGVGGGPIGKVSGFGFTTACHLLADLGLPLFKPDIWVCRIASLLPGVQAEIRRAWQLDGGEVPFDFLASKLVGPRAPEAYRRIVQPVMNALVDELKEVSVDEFDLTPAFLRERFVDWTLVHFAISAEPDIFGLERRPVDLLCGSAGNLATPAHIKALAKLLQDSQATHEAARSLLKAQSRVRKADTHSKQVLADRRIGRLLSDDAHKQRCALRAKASASSVAYETEINAARWQLAPRYPDGFASEEASSRWKCIQAAGTPRALGQ